MGNRGFTLLEVVIAMAIMVMAFAAILSIESSSIDASIRARTMNIVAMLAKGQMVETELKIEGKTFEEVKKEEGANFAPPYDDYRWKSEIKEVEFPHLNVGASKDNANGGDQTSDLISKLITQFLSKAVREVTVTVYWKKGSGEQRYSISTYWVDLNHEFQLSQ